jgi:tricorn protease
MELDGLIEFHRGYLEEIEREGLIVDVRYNTGGMISPLLLEKLERRKRHIGFNRTRWSRTPEPYPYDTITGPMVALTNELTGSDGDLFSNGFKMMGLGPLIGKRTWGGVIGISPRNPLVDGTITTQPENAFWFFGPGWGIENHGVEPDIEVENLPQDYARGFDRQLDRGIQEILKLLESDPPRKPAFEPPPNRSLPRLDR